MRHKSEVDMTERQLLASTSISIKTKKGIKKYKAKGSIKAWLLPVLVIISGCVLWMI